MSCAARAGPPQRSILAPLSPDQRASCGGLLTRCSRRRRPPLLAPGRQQAEERLERHAPAGAEAGSAAPGTASREARRPTGCRTRRPAGTPEPLRAELTGLLGADKVLRQISDLVRYASDASPYRFVPQVVVVAEDIDDVSAVLSYAHGKGREVVFRAAGTSLNGQAQGEDILVDVRRHWAGVEVHRRTARGPRIGPGTTVVRANATLARHGRRARPGPGQRDRLHRRRGRREQRLGHDGGHHPELVPDGRLAHLRTALGHRRGHRRPRRGRAARARANRPCAWACWRSRREIEADAELVARIRAKYEIKNTNGYRLDAFLDGDDPGGDPARPDGGLRGHARLHLRGRLRHAAPATGRSSTALLFFPSLPAAAAARPAVQRGGRDGRRADGRQHAAGLGAAWRGCPPTGRALPKATTALLVEFRAPDEAAQERTRRRPPRCWTELELVAPVASVTNAFTRDPKTIGWLLEGPQGVRHGGRRITPLRDDADHRGLRGAAVPAGRGLRGAARTPAAARLRRRRRRPRRARQSALPARLRRGAGPRTWSGTPPSWTSSAASPSSASTAR